MTWDIDPTLIGPYALPWHALLALLDVASIVFVLWYWRKNGQLSSEQWMWPVILLIGHAFYTFRLADEHPTFELEIRYYGVFFAIGLLGAARSFPLYFERWGFPKSHGEGLTLWTPIGMLIGAHLVHLVFYEWDAFVENPIRIFQLGSGLASHGGGLGAILATLWFARRNKVDPMRYMDPAMCAATFVIPWVRVGNFFNSEIVGRAWDGPWAIVFPRHDCPGYPGFTTAAGVFHEVPLCDAAVPRHPSQVYEAILGFIMVGIAVYLQRRWRNRLRPGAHLFILLAYYFTTRFFIEYVKDYQAISENMPFTMGQMLSAPIVLVSLYMLIFSKKSNIRTVIADESVIDNPPPFDGGTADERGEGEKPKRRKAGADEASASGDDEPPKKRRVKKKRKKRS